jgi:hypothetical protein
MRTMVALKCAELPGALLIRPDLPDEQVTAKQGRDENQYGQAALSKTGSTSGRSGCVKVVMLLMFATMLAGNFRQESVPSKII